MNIKVEVNYKVKEYRQALLEFIPIAISKENEVVDMRLPWNWLFVRRAIIWLIAPIALLFKKLILGKCSFEFNETGFNRKSKINVGNRTWDQVVAIYKLSSAYIIELKEGCLLVPFRVFSKCEQVTFEATLDNKLFKT